MEQNNTPASEMQLLAQKAKLQLDGEREALSAGMAGIVQVRFTCSDDWDGLGKIAVFTNGTVSVDVPDSEWDDGVCTIPREVLACAGKTVLAGLYGTDGESIILPTRWCSLGRVEAGAEPASVQAAPPSVPILAQLHARISALEENTAVQPGASGGYRTAAAQDTLDAQKQPKEISVQHITATSVEGALEEIGAQLDGLDAALAALL